MVQNDHYHHEGETLDKRHVKPTIFSSIGGTHLGTFSKNFGCGIFILSQTAQLDIQIYLVLSVLCTRKEKFEIERCAV